MRTTIVQIAITLSVKGSGLNIYSVSGPQQQNVAQSPPPDEVKVDVSEKLHIKL